MYKESYLKMHHTIRFSLLLASLILLLSQITVNDAFAQIVRGQPVGGITLKPFQIFEVGIKLKAATNLKYNFSADNTLLFDIHSHDGQRINTYSLMESKVFDGVFVAPVEGDYYFLAQNVGQSEVNMRYDISISHEMHVIEYEGMQYDIITISNSDIQILEFSQENKQISFRIQTPYLTPGYVNITIPRNLLDGPFNVRGSLTEHVYSKDNSSSTFTIRTPNGIHDFSVIGTTVVPEVPFPAVLLALTIASFLVMVKVKLKKF
jgi:hypothetical protein